jgi:presenilin-like A22 family membrane protease
LLSGYVWLFVSGLVALIYGAVPAGPVYDAMLHSIFLGFVFAMIFGHAPIIFPAVLEIDIEYKSYFYLPLILLHVSLIIRIGGELMGSGAARLWGGLFNVIAVIIYLGMLAPIGSRRKSNLR